MVYTSAFVSAFAWIAFCALSLPVLVFSSGFSVFCLYLLKIGMCLLCHLVVIWSGFLLKDIEKLFYILLGAFLRKPWLRRGFEIWGIDLCSSDIIPLCLGVPAWHVLERAWQRRNPSKDIALSPLHFSEFRKQKKDDRKPSKVLLIICQLFLQRALLLLHL